MHFIIRKGKTNALKLHISKYDREKHGFPERCIPKEIYYWNKVTVHHMKLCYFLMKQDNKMICGVLLNHCLTVNRIISKSVCLDTRLRDTSLKRCGVKSQFTNSVSCVSIIGVDASLTTTTHASTTTTHAYWRSPYFVNIFVQGRLEFCRAVF